MPVEIPSIATRERIGSIIIKTAVAILKYASSGPCQYPEGSPLVPLRACWIVSTYEDATSKIAQVIDQDFIQKRFFKNSTNNNGFLSKSTMTIMNGKKEYISNNE